MSAVQPATNHFQSPRVLRRRPAMFAHKLFCQTLYWCIRSRLYFLRSSGFHIVYPLLRVCSRSRSVLASFGERSISPLEQLDYTSFGLRAF